MQQFCSNCAHCSKSPYAEPCKYCFDMVHKQVDGEWRICWESEHPTFDADEEFYCLMARIDFRAENSAARAKIETAFRLCKARRELGIEGV